MAFLIELFTKRIAKQLLDYQQAEETAFQGKCATWREKLQLMKLEQYKVVDIQKVWRGFAQQSSSTTMREKDTAKAYRERQLYQQTLRKPKHSQQT